ncbi:hypothetical protein Z042_08670 [Chania multitudinisentens RB-25]|uniref:Flagellar protein FliL n=1 Tax=Chania multitudinisentens RB-25 TaxID=1441930 RepID=W0LBP3_9GAMM|nr:flagellar basal body-associated FliL family protein [Chania multitudinisentens]AHG19687.1 hypothetical protein Z042_08670 [Chania multitudinisentens RB-25]
MNVRGFFFWGAIALVISISAAAFTLAGSQLLKVDEKTGKNNFTKLFKSSAKQKVEFVVFSDMIFTLKGEGSEEHYLLLELSLVTNDLKKAKIVDDMNPVIRGATVTALSNMSYNNIRMMSVQELSEKLKQAYSDTFKNLNVPIPFDDVIISKMVYQ